MFRFLLRNSRKVQKMRGAGCCIRTIWLATTVQRTCWVVFSVNFPKTWKSGFEVWEKNEFRLPKSESSQLFCFQYFLKEPWFWINLYSYDLCLQNSLGDWGGEQVAIGWDVRYPCAGQSLWTPLRARGEDGDVSLLDSTQHLAWAWHVEGC